MRLPVVDAPLNERQCLLDLLRAYDDAGLQRPLIDFNPVLTPRKVYTANVLLAFLALIEPDEISYFDKCGHKARQLRATFSRGQFFTRINGAVRWMMVGFRDARPIVVFSKSTLQYGVYFDRCLFVDTDTGGSYLPAPDIVIRNLSLSCPTFSRVPFSWGSDIVSIDFHSDLVFVLHTCLGAIPRAQRKQFRGFKYFSAKHKYLLCPYAIRATERTFANNNGFQAGQHIGTAKELGRFVGAPLKRYFTEQRRLTKKAPGHSP